jgi:hypothetical protein
MTKTELRSLIREQIKKVMLEAKESKATTDPETIKSNFNNDVTGYYIVKGGQFGSNKEFWNEDKVKKWIFYTPDYDEANQDKYVKDGYTRVELTEDGEIDIATF